MKALSIFSATAVAAVFMVQSAIADINRVRVVNEADKTVYIHTGGYAPAFKLKPGESKIFYYPFYVTPPNSDKKIATSLLIATSGGRWLTTPNGYTYLSKPTLMICLDYRSPEHSSKTGNRLWTIKKAEGFDKDCKVKGYKQPWFQPSK